MFFKKIIPMLLLTTVLGGSVWAKSDRDGDSRIAFIQGPDVYTMKPDGTAVRQLTNLGPNNSAFWLAWSPDARQLIFTEFPPNVPSQLWVMNADGSNQHLLLNDPSYADTAAAFSPSGGEVAFTRCQTTSNGTCAIYTVGTDGTALTPVTNFQLSAFDFAPVFSPDRLTIAFESYNREGVLGAIYLVNIDGSDVRQLTPAELGAYNPSWSPDGEKIAFETHCCNPQNSDIWTINRNREELTRLTGTAKTDLDIPVAYYNEFPSWSPRGNAIVFAQYLVSSSSSAIFITNDDGSGCTQVLALPPAPRKPDASRGKRRHHGPREIEKGGADPRWSPARS